MYYEIINPSDCCGFYADSYMAATLATVVLGNGQYGAKPDDAAAKEVPLFLFGGFDEWWNAEFPDEPLEGVLERNKEAVGLVLRSVCYGTAAERRLYEDAVASITDDEKRAEFVAKWNDEKRTSMNNIMERAHKIADQLLSTATNEQ
jgi:hypothetical protein